MKKSVFIFVLCFAVLFSSGLSCVNFSASAAVDEKPAVEVLQTVKPEKDIVKLSRLENMLNHNFLYGDDFSDMNTVINNSCLALLEKMEDQFISTDILFPFIENAYGISVYLDDDFGEGFPKKDGAVYVVPRGFTSYTHTVINLVEEGDTLTVTSLALSESHDGEKEELVCTTVFKVNRESAFGYNIVESNLKAADGIEL